MSCEQCKNNPTPYHTSCAADEIARLREELADEKEKTRIAVILASEYKLWVEKAETELEQVKSDLSWEKGMVDAEIGRAEHLSRQLDHERTSAEQAERERDETKLLYAIMSDACTKALNERDNERKAIEWASTNMIQNNGDWEIILSADEIRNKANKAKETK